jgi:hypothetical protein
VFTLRAARDLFTWRAISSVILALSSAIPRRVSAFCGAARYYFTFRAAPISRFPFLSSILLPSARIRLEFLLSAAPPAITLLFGRRCSADFDFYLRCFLLPRSMLVDFHFYSAPPTIS